MTAGYNETILNDQEWEKVEAVLSAARNVVDHRGTAGLDAAILALDKALAEQDLGLCVDCGTMCVLDGADVICPKCETEAQAQATDPKTLLGKRYRTLVDDSEEDSEYGEVTHPVGSVFVVRNYSPATRLFTVAWQHAVDANGKAVPAEGMWTLWTIQELFTEAEPTA